ncbi:hypothetical protein OHA77_17690 [Streptosporangium sp. NBC_01639]|uniref:hypothetical protein n=1 Tax=Streptosporangium sp. NBC_01639 TaxID=2975948 RepID=UPI003864A334|nr:hypothetical protein OHA77_17690 [Streptosporangium sp. NBC_01639]
MIGIRLIGTPAEVAEAALIVREAFIVTGFRGPYPSRHTSAHVRLYLEVQPS